MSLIRLMPGGEVQSSTLNDNFDYLEGLISSSVSTLDAKVNSTTGNIANITSNMATIQTNLTNATNTANSKASKDLSDVNPSASFKTLVKSYGVPDYSKAVSISSGYTVPSYGWFYVHVRGYSGGSYSIAVNGKTLVTEKSDGGLCSADVSLRVSPNDNITFTNPAVSSQWFIPDKN